MAVSYDRLLKRLYFLGMLKVNPRCATGIPTVSSFYVVLPRLNMRSSDLTSNRLLTGPESRPELQNSDIRIKILEILKNGPIGKAGILIY